MAALPLCIAGALGLSTSFFALPLCLRIRFHGRNDLVGGATGGKHRIEDGRIDHAALVSFVATPHSSRYSRTSSIERQTACGTPHCLQNSRNAVCSGESLPPSFLT